MSDDPWRPRSAPRRSGSGGGASARARVDAALVQRFRRARRDPSLVVLEGFHALKHAVRFGAELVTVVCTRPSASRQLAERLAPDLCPVLSTAESVAGPTYEALAPQPHPTGVIALARRPACGVEAILQRPGPEPVVLLEEPSHLGNLGAAVRAAAAAGAAGLVSVGRHDPWHPEAVRAAAGLQFALPVARLPELAALPRPERFDRILVAVSPDGAGIVFGASGGATTLPDRAVLAFGNERRGLSKKLIASASRRVSIPMRAGVSSLNLATAVAVVLYAAWSGRT